MRAVIDCPQGDPVATFPSIRLTVSAAVGLLLLALIVFAWGDTGMATVSGKTTTTGTTTTTVSR
jgi:hypothetical protein